MKKIIYAVILLLVVSSVAVLAIQKTKKGSSEKAAPKLQTPAEPNAILDKWVTTPEGIHFNNWKASPEGQRVLAGAAKLKKHIRDSVMMEAVVTSLTLPPNSRLGYGVMVRMNEDEYILSFGRLKSTEFQQLRSLKVNDTIMIKSHGVSYAPKYAYPIVSGNYVERNSKLIYKAPPRKRC